MIESEFWKDWKDINSIEQIAIESVKKALEILFETIDEKNIYAIYIKGSFVNREMNKKSDVDLVPITKDNETLEEIKKLQENKGEGYKPAEFVPRSIWEFENHKKYNFKGKTSGNPDQFTRNIHYHKLIYGKKLDTSKYIIRDDKTRLKAHIKVFEKVFIPFYRANKVSFNDNLKQVFWLTISEERIKGNNPPYSWKGLDELVKDPNHIIHKATKLRLNPTEDPKIKEEFIQKIKKYLDELKSLT